MNERIVRACDRKNLNVDVPFLAGVNPTAENIAIRIWDVLQPAVSPGRLVRVELHETERNSVRYRGEDE